MDRKLKVRVNLIICAVILAGFFAVGLTSYSTYSATIRDDIVNISKLTATNIYSDISNELTKPIFVSLTMANDNFLKSWLKAETTSADPAAHERELQSYLLGLRQKYGYDSVFMISEATKTYYHFQGVNKVVSPNDEHDRWYFSFIERNIPYDLDIDTDEANHNRLSVFINCRVTGEDGRLMGVTGVGLELNEVQDLLKSFEHDFQLEALLFNRDGLVQVHTNARNIEHENVFDLPELSLHRQEVLNNRTNMQVYQYDGNPSDGYLITRYIDDLDWYLLINKDISVLERSFATELVRDFILFVAVALTVLLIVNRIIMQKERALISMAKTDQLTGLPNRRGFNELLERSASGVDGGNPLFVFVFDIDNFKKINDGHGHLIGDKILQRIGQAASEAFAGLGDISRWGGDEFAGYARGSRQEVMDRVERFFRRVQDDPEFKAYATTLSMGITEMHGIDTPDTLIYRADQALYEAKETGKNRYIVIDGVRN